MKRFVSLLLLCFLVAGCGRADSNLDRAMQVRQKFLEASCSFDAIITADYGEAVYDFSMHCTSNQEGSVTFCVNEPTSISGISGEISAEGGKLTFDDKALLFSVLSEGLPTPVCAPWLFVRSMRSGYISGCAAETDGGITIVIDDSYDQDTISVHVTLDRSNIPVGAQIYWNGMRIVTVIVNNFNFA